MTNAGTPAMRNQALISLVLVLTAMFAAWKVGGWIVGESTGNLSLFVLAMAWATISVVILRNWRSGLYLFVVWLLFEDLFRKYFGNNMTIYFAKDVLAALTCFSLLVAIRAGRERAFRPPFLLSLSFFFWLGVLQVFNPYSPSLLYGLLGLKLYFYYIPLMFVGYAFIRNDEDLHRFLVFNMGLVAVIAGLGIVQAIVGPTFLQPEVLQADIRGLATLQKVAPISGKLVTLPTGVFVSAGRFSWYLILLWILGLGAAGYLLLFAKRGRKLVFLALGVVAVAGLLSGSRTAVVSIGASGLALVAAFLWGAPWRWGQAHRLVKAIRWVAIVVAICVALAIFVVPAAVGGRWAFYSETLLPESPAYELGFRTWDYPVHNIMLALSEPNWVYGNGIGTASLGIQYVSRFLGQPPPAIGVESGYGTLIVELGILGPILWILWTGSLVVHGWKVVRRLRQTRLFPVGFAIFWFLFLLLFPFTFAGMQAYQNYVFNAYLWLLVGVLFRLPGIVTRPVTALTESRAPRPSRPFVRLRAPKGKWIGPAEIGNR